MRRVLVFGTFDGLHTGHQFFLRRAKALGDELFVSVARDAHVQALKQKTPVAREQERLRQIEQLPFVHEAFFSDESLGSFSVIDYVKPDLIVLGHDQTALEEALKEWMALHQCFVPTKRMRKFGSI